MPTVTRDACPRCRTDVSRRLGVITTPTIACPKCRAVMDVTRTAVVNNWQFNGAVLAAAFIWTAVAAAVFLNPNFATQVGARVGRPARTPQDRLVLAAIVGVPAGFFALPFGVLGRLVGYGVARRLGARRPDVLGKGLVWLDEQSQPGDQFLVTRLLGASAVEAGGPVRPPPARTPTAVPRPAPPRPAGAGRSLRRVVAGGAWAVVFFVAAAVVLAAVAASGVGEDAQLRQQAVEASARAWGVWAFVGSLAVAAVLGGTGWLPGTRRAAA